MKQIKKLLLFLIIIVLFNSNCRPEHEYDLIVSNVNLIDGTGKDVQEAVSIGVNDGEIVVISKEINSKAQNHIDGTDKYLIPGLVDGHVHTTNYDRDFPRLIHYGVTSVFITGGSLCTNAYYAKMRERGEQDSIPAPRVFHTSQHFSMEGRHPSKTYPSPNWLNGKSIFFLKDTLQIEQLVPEVARQPIVGIKLTIEDGPAPPFVERMPQELVEKTVREASKHGLEVFAHVSDNVELEMALRAGVQNLVHFTGVDIDPEDSIQTKLLSEFRKKDPSWVTTVMIDKSFLYPLRPEWFENEHLLPENRAMAEEVTEEAKSQALNYLKIYMEGYGLADSSLSALMTPQIADIKWLYDQGFNMVLGTDTGNTFNFHGYSLHEEMQLLEMGGMRPLDILKMGTLNAAKMLKVDGHLGSIEVGKLADMILLDENPLDAIENTLSIHSVIKNGKHQKRISIQKESQK